MGTYYVLDEAGDPVREPDPLAWSRWFETADRHVCDTNIGGVRVSTVFLGIDHNFGPGGGAPVLWETMVFGGPLDGEQRRYASRDEARAGHEAMVRAVREAADGDRSAVG